MNLEKLINLYSGRKFGEFILQLIQNQTLNSIEEAINEKIDLIPTQFEEKIKYIFFECLKLGHEKSFWENECSETYIFLTIKAKEYFLQYGVKQRDKDLINLVHIIILILAYYAINEKKVRITIEKAISISFFNRLFKNRDISQNYRWSIIFKNNGVPQFEMLGDNVFRMLGYYMITIGEKGDPVKPWELFLRCNKNGKGFQLAKEYFPDSDKINDKLFNKIKDIDANYQVDKFKKEVFISRITGEYIKLKSSFAEYENEFQDDFESMDDGTFEEREMEKEKEMTFFKALNNIFK